MEAGAISLLSWFKALVKFEEGLLVFPINWLLARNVRTGLPIPSWISPVGLGSFLYRSNRVRGALGKSE